MEIVYTKWVRSNCGSSAIARSRASDTTASAAPGTTRTRPPRSAMNNRPSGATAMSLGTSTSSATTSRRKTTPFPKSTRVSRHWRADGAGAPGCGSDCGRSAADGVVATTLTRSAEDRALSITDPSTMNDASSSVCMPGVSAGRLAEHANAPFAAVGAHVAFESSERALSTYRAYRIAPISAALRRADPSRGAPHR